MSANHVFERADKAARTVDPLMLAQALDHIAKSAAKSRTSTRRLRWIEQRAIFALEGREYRDIDLDLPKDPEPGTQGRHLRRIAFLLSAMHRIKALGPTPAVLAIVDEALGCSQAQARQPEASESPAASVATCCCIGGICRHEVINGRTATGEHCKAQLQDTLGSTS